MGNVDYSDREVRHRVEAVMVNPNDMDDELGILPITVGSAKIDQGYYVDDRIGASLTTQAWGDYIQNSWIRLYHICSTPATGDIRHERGTFAVKDATIGTSMGRTVFDMTLMSALGTIANDHDAWPFSIGMGARASAVIDAICSKCGRPYALDEPFTDYIWRTSTALEAGKSFRSRLYEACSTSGNRMTVDTHGILRFSQYVNPTQAEPSMALDADDPRSIIVDGSVMPDTNLFRRPSRSIVIYKDDAHVISAQSDMPVESPTSTARRGFTVAELHELSDLGSPKSVAHAQELAADLLAADSAPTTVWQAETLWLPLSQADVISFAPRGCDPFGGGSPRKCLVQSIEETTTRLKLTLKEV